MRARDAQSGRFVRVAPPLAWAEWADAHPVTDDLLPTCAICERVGADHSRTIRILEAGYLGSAY